MAHFYADVVADRGKPVGKISHKRIETHTRGWGLGVAVEGERMGEQDVFRLYATMGSENPKLRKLIGLVEMVRGELKFFPAPGRS